MQVREVAISEPTTRFLPDQVQLGEGKKRAAEPRGIEFMVGFEIELSSEALLIPSLKNETRIGSSNPINQLSPALDTSFWGSPFPLATLRCCTTQGQIGRHRDDIAH